MSVDKFSEYKFLIGKSTKIEGVLETENVDTIAKSDFVDVETFEKSLLKTSKMEDTIITYTTKPEGYTNQDSIKLTLKISNTKGIKTIEFPDGGIIECFGRTEYSKDYSAMVNGTYTYKVTDMEGNETTKEILIDKIDKLPPKNFIPEIQKSEGKTIIIENGEDAEADGTNSKSGIVYYEYYVIDENNVTTKYETNQIDNLALGAYKAYVIAYDKAGNSTKSGIVNFKVSVQFSDISAGALHSFAIDTKGNLWAWGWNYYGQLGNGQSGSYITSPIQIKEGTTFKQVAAGNEHSLAIDSAGNLWAWGSNDYGQLGNGNSGSGYGERSPVQIKKGTIFKQISAGYASSLAIDVNGNRWAWGYNVGIYGNGTTLSKYSPVQITEETKFEQLSVGVEHCLGIDDSGNLWTWGYEQKTPAQKKEGTNFKQISQGGLTSDIHSQNYCLAIDSEGNLWAWGLNSYGQLGDGTTEDKTEPVHILPERKFIQVSAGASCSLAIDNEGNIWTWGWNGYGQLGDGTTADKTIPVQITSGIKFKKISAGERHNLAIDNEGNIWAWGYNGYGQLGDGTLVTKLTPVQI